MYFFIFGRFEPLRFCSWVRLTEGLHNIHGKFLVVNFFEFSIRDSLFQKEKASLGSTCKELIHDQSSKSQHKQNWLDYQTNEQLLYLMFHLNISVMPFKIIILCYLNFERIYSYLTLYLYLFIRTEDGYGSWWKADMGETKCVGKVVIWNRVETVRDAGCCGLLLLDSNFVSLIKTRPIRTISELMIQMW